MPNPANDNGDGATPWPLWAACGIAVGLLLLVGLAGNRLENLFEKVTADETVKAFKKVSRAAGQTIDLEKEIAKGA